MTKIDIVSGFLGAGKTTLIKKLLAEAFPGEKLVLIENEFGEISIDGGFLKESGVQISEMSAGCICCSLVGDFHKALKDVQAQFHPDRILIEPSGVGKLSDVIVAVQNTADETDDMKLNSFVTVADATKVKVYMKNFGEFYNNQIEAAGTIILSRTQKMSQEKLEAAVAMLREKNADAAILTTPWDQLDGKTILAAIEKVSLADELLEKMRAEHAADEAEHEHAHHHHDHEHDEHEHEHEHDHEHDHDDHDHDHEGESEMEYDEHIWTSPVIAKDLLYVTRDAIIQADPANAATYQKNADAYAAQLDALNESFTDYFAEPEHRTLLFADKFPLQYFANTYGLHCYAAFSGCSSDTEPSIATISNLMHLVESDHLSKVYYLEVSSPAVANVIGEQTGATPTVFQSCHTLTQTDFDNGETYVSLMQRNLKALESQ